MERIYLIFVPDKDIDEDALGYSGIIEWCYQNLSNPNVMVLSLDDIYLLQYESEILNIINEENESMLQVGEDDWIIASEIKLRIQQRLLKYTEKIKNQREMIIIYNLLNLLKISIEIDKSLYFIF